MPTDPDVLNFCDSLALARAHARCRKALLNPDISARDAGRLRKLLSKETLLGYESCREAWCKAALPARLNGKAGMNMHCFYCKVPRNRFAPDYCARYPIRSYHHQTEHSVYRYAPWEHLWIKGTSPRLRQYVARFHKLASKLANA